MLKHLAIAAVGLLMMVEQTGAVEHQEVMPLIIKASSEKDLEALHRNAEQGSIDAQKYLGLMYRIGLNVPQDYAEAIRWYRKAAEQGDAEAQLRLGYMYTLGRGVLQDDTEAAHWYGKAAEQGHTEAQVTIGWMYEEGRGVPQDYLEAAEWYQKASEQRHALALRNLGQMYKHGRGVSQDDILAHMYLNLSASVGDNVARTSRDTLAGRMTSDQIIEAQRFAREWLALRR